MEFYLVKNSIDNELLDIYRKGRSIRGMKMKNIIAAILLTLSGSGFACSTYNTAGCINTGGPVVTCTVVGNRIICR